MQQDIKNEIKSYIAKSGWTQTTSQNISNKLARGTIKYSECKEIADIIGFSIEWEQIK